MLNRNDNEPEVEHDAEDDDPNHGDGEPDDG